MIHGTGFVSKYVFARLDGEPGVRVRPPNKSVRPGEVAYDPEIHKGRLLCPDPKCCVKLHYNKGSETMAGDAAHGLFPHFKANPGQEHYEHCTADIPDLDGTQLEEEDMDPSLGWRIYLNMGGGFSNEFNRTSRKLVGVNEKGRVTLLDQNLKKRERKTAKTPADLVKLMKTGEFARLRDSVVINREGVFPWTDFLVRTSRLGGKPSFKRWIALAQRLLVDADQPAFIEFSFDRHIAAKSDRNWRRLEIPQPMFVARHPVDGRVIRVIPKIQACHEDLLGLGMEPGTYMALTLPEMHRSAHDRNLYFMTVKLRDPRHVMKGSIRDAILDVKPVERAPVAPRSPAGEYQPGAQMRLL